jgi:hypothetical protein
MNRLAAVLLSTSTLFGCSAIEKAPMEAAGLAFQATQPFNAFFLVFNGMKFYFKSQIPESKVAKSKGQGKTKDEAIQSALKNVVQETVGTMIVTESLVEKDKLVYDLSLMYSSGIVEYYEVVRCSDKNEVECEISAIVSTGSFYKKVMHSSKVIKFDGNQIYAQQATLKNSLEQQKKMTEYQFSRIRKDGLEPKITKMTVVPLKNNKVRVDLDYTVEWREDFKKNFVKFLQKLEKDTEKMEDADEIYLQWAPSGMFSNRVRIKTIDSEMKTIVDTYQHSPIFVKIDDMTPCIEHKVAGGVVNLQNVVVNASVSFNIDEKKLQKMQKLSISTNCQKA